MDHSFSLPGDTRQSLIAATQLILPHALRLDSRQARCGGMQAIMNGGGLLFLEPICLPGTMLSDEHRAMFTHYALEKLFRTHFGDGQSSRTTGYDPRQGRHAGAVRHLFWIFSFSALHEMLDEALVLSQYCLMKKMTVEEAHGFQNPEFSRLIAIPEIATALV